MKYCTNCGVETKKKICNSCGVKNNTTHNYCGWCGSEIQPNASICTNCGNSIKENKLLPILTPVLTLLIAFPSFFILLSDLNYYPKIPFILMNTAAVVSLPFVNTILKKLFANKIKQKNLITKLWAAFVALLVALSFILLFTNFFNSAVNGAKELTSESATRAAEIVFHEQYELKNESSYVLNDSSVTIIYEDDEVAELSVSLDYSAQNGFGGTNRNTKTIFIKFDKVKGGYYREDGTYIAGQY